MKVGFDFIGVTTPFYCNDGLGNFLLHKRSENCRDEIGRWDPGAGRLEFGLTVEENVLKEVAEEYGCQGIIQEQLPAHDIYREFEGKQTHWLAVPFLVKVDREKVIIAEPDKISELGWFKLNELPKPLHLGFQYSFSRLQNYLKKYCNYL